MSCYNQERLKVASNIKNDPCIEAYKLKLNIKMKMSKIFLNFYYFFMLFPFFINIPTYFYSKEISDLFVINGFSLFSFFLAIVMLVYGVKIKHGSGFYELPIIAQTVGKKDLNIYDNEYLIALAGKDGASMIKDILSNLTKLKLIENENLKMRDFRAIEDIIVSKRSQAQ